MTKIKDEDLKCVFCHRKASDSANVKFIRPDENADFVICEDCLKSVYETVFGSDFDLTESFKINTDDTDLTKDDLNILNEHPDIPFPDFIAERPKVKRIPRPDEIMDYLNNHIIGQEEAKKVIAVAAYNHYKMLQYDTEHENDQNATELQRSNVIVVGPSGVGKTETIRALAKFMNVPLAICDCSSLSKTGYR